MGADAATFFRLLWRNRFDVPAGLRGGVVSNGVSAVLNSGLGMIESMRFSRRLAKTPPVRDPLFVLGHWRTGTTLLHELLALDPLLAAPSAYQCLSPHHFLLTEPTLKDRFSQFMPEQRAMDQMRIGSDSPFEDEFALCLLGARSPYETLAFPNRGHMTPAMFDPEGFTPRDRRRWYRTMAGFTKKVAFHNPGRRLVLKSPPHTARVRALLRLYPEARFVHIVRNPYEVYPSALHTAKELYRAHSFQRPDGRGTEERVLEIFTYLYESFERDRHLIPAGRLHELRYEDLLADPPAAMGSLYAGLGLPESDSFLPAVTRYFEQRHDYQRNQFRLTSEVAGLLSERWASVMNRYGYPRVSP